MTTYLTQITDYLLTQSWQIAILVAAVATVNLALKNKSAHARYLLWLIVLAKCLVPPLLAIPLPVLPPERSAEPVRKNGTISLIRAMTACDWARVALPASISRPQICSSKFAASFLPAKTSKRLPFLGSAFFMALSLAFHRDSSRTSFG